MGSIPRLQNVRVRRSWLRTPLSLSPPEGKTGSDPPDRKTPKKNPSDPGENLLSSGSVPFLPRFTLRFFFLANRVGLGCRRYPLGIVKKKEKERTKGTQAQEFARSERDPRVASAGIVSDLEQKRNSMRTQASRNGTSRSGSRTRSVPFAESVHEGRSLGFQRR